MISSFVTAVRKNEYTWAKLNAMLSYVAKNYYDLFFFFFWTIFSLRRKTPRIKCRRWNSFMSGSRNVLKLHERGIFERIYPTERLVHAHAACNEFVRTSVLDPGTFEKSN